MSTSDLAHEGAVSAARGARVLIFGDDLSRATVLAYALRASGISPLVAVGRAEALVRATAEAPDAVVFDVPSPRERATMTRILRELMPGLPALHAVRPVVLGRLVRELGRVIAARSDPAR